MPVGPVRWRLVRQSAHLIIHKSPKMDQRKASLIVVNFTVGGAFISFVFASRLLLPPILIFCIARFPMVKLHEQKSESRRCENKM